MATNGHPPQTTQANLNSVLNEDASKNRVAVHTFNPDASPQEKGAAAGQGKDKLQKPSAASGPAREVAVDSGGDSVVPTITISDAETSDDNLPTSPAEPAASIPGEMPTAPAPPVPEWFRIGWREVGGIDVQSESPEEKEKTAFEQFVNDQYYGEWYHNAAIIIFAVVTSHFLTRFHLGWGWTFVLLAFCSTYYRASIGRFRQRARDDIQRELVKTRLETEHESAEWMNNFLNRFWLIYEPVLSQTIVASVDQILSTNTPAFLDSIRLTTFTLGTKAPRIDRVKTSPKTADDVILMEWGLSFNPNDVSELTPRQIADKVNPKIVLAVRVGKGLASATMPILLEDITFSGLLKVRLKLMTTFPHVQLVDLSFLEKPVIDYVLKPIGGETFGFDIGNIPGLSAFIRDMVHATLGPMMYDPNVFTLNLEQLLSGEPLDTAIGVLQVTVESARGLKGTKIGGGTPDPYVSLSISNRGELARTKYKHNTSNPTWMETKFLLVNSLTDVLMLSLYDYNDHRKNSLMGNATFDLSNLREDASAEGQEAPILKDGKQRGMMRFDVNFYPVLKPEIDQDGVAEVLDTKAGIVRLTLHQAKELDHGKSSSNELNPFCKVYLGSNTHPIHKTTRMKHTNNPVWESSTEFLCTDKASSVVTIKVIDDRDLLKDPTIGMLSIRLEDLLEAKKEAGKDWWPLSHCRSGRLRMSAEWKPLNMPGNVHGVDQYTPPIGVVRLWLQRATDIKNVEATLGGKSDPYVRVQINNVTQGRTEVVNNNLNPQWDQIIYIPVHSLRETMMLECMDYQNLTKDRSLGYVELKVSELAQSSEGEKPYISTGKKDFLDGTPIKLDKGTYKGKLHFVAEFVPALPLKGLHFNSVSDDIKRIADGAMSEGDGDTVRSDNESMLDKEDASMPVNITVTEPMDDEAQPEEQSKGHRKTTSTATADTAITVDSTVSGKSAITADTSLEEKRAEEAGLELSKDELLRYQSGVLIVNVLSGQLQKKARLEVLLDDAYWPAFSTIRPRSTHAQWEYIGEGFVKELDFGRVWLRLNEADEGDKDDIIAEWKGDTKVFLQQTLDGPSSFVLTDRDDPDKRSTVQLEARYDPVPITLEPRESINNQGVLRVELLDGREIHGVDRGGKSDPFVVFQLNGHKVFKSQTKKKTLTPEWNETFTCQVPSRVGADFSLEVFDWNQIEQAKSLGSGKIDLTDLEPFESIERVVSLSSAKHGEKGSIRLRLLFQPEIIVKSRKNTSTFSTAGRAMTQIGHLPVGAGKGVISGVTGVFKKDFAKRGGSVESDDNLSAKDLPMGQASQPVGASSSLSAGTAFPTINGVSAVANGGQEPGTLRVTVLDAKDIVANDVKPYVVIRVGDKEQKTKTASKTTTPEWNESFIFAAAPATQTKLFAWIYDHKTLGKDKTLGSAEIDIWRHLQPGVGGVPAADVMAELREGGLLRLRLEFDHDNVLSTNRSRSSFQSGGERTLTSPSRFSLSRRRAEKDE